MADIPLFSISSIVSCTALNGDLDIPLFTVDSVVSCTAINGSFSIPIIIGDPSPPNSLVVSSVLAGITGSFELETELSLSLSSALDGIIGSFELETMNPFENIKVEFFLTRTAFEDISIINEWQRMVWSLIHVTFDLEAPGTYNFEDIPLEFLVDIGAVFSDIPVIFSVILNPQAFVSYVLQKPYLVISEVGPTYADLVLSNWNVKPNQTWFVHVNSYTVTIYESEADMLAVSNAIAVGTADASTLETILTYVDEYEGDVEFYYQDVAYHVSLSEVIAGDRYFKIKPFTDLTEIRHPIYNNSSVILMRGQAELNLHTYTVLGREVILGSHIPEMEVGECVDLASTRRNVTSEKSQILSQTISGSVSENGEASLVNSIRVANYTELYR